MAAAEGALPTIPSTPDHRVSTGVDRPRLHLHLFMLFVCGILLAVSVVGFRLTSTSGMPSLPAVIALLVVSAFPAVVWHDRRRHERRDAALTLPWIIALILLIPLVAVLSGRLHFPLRDAVFARIDHALGFDVPAIMRWSSQHRRIGDLLKRSYPLLFWLLAAAVIIPIAMGKRVASEQFLLANTIALLLAMPVFTLFPAVGPWIGYHFQPDAAQRAVESSIALLHNRASVPDTINVVGIVCFPSFHVIWAVLSAAALSSVKPLRIPATVLASLIMASTVTTGWHYVSDALGGILIAAIGILAARHFLTHPTVVARSAAAAAGPARHRPNV
jgi:membrane-associated phospholipid phosphatase